MFDEKWGEVGRAFIVLHRPGATSCEALHAHCERLLGRYKVPKQFAFLDQLPRNASGKVLKTRLRTHEVREVSATISE